MQTPDPSESKISGQPERAFTLVELLVVLGVLAILATAVLPGLAAGKYKSKTARCAVNMRLWGMATAMYASDNGDAIPYFGEDGAAHNAKFWPDYLAPYVARVNTPGTWFPATNSGGSSYASEFTTNELRRCPAGKATSTFWGWDAWIGANFGGYADTSTLSGPFVYAQGNGHALRPPLKMNRIRKPADALAYTEAYYHYVYSPVSSGWPFSFLYGDGSAGPADSSAMLFSTYGVPYNHARPKVHENGANVTLLDGHVERVAFKDLWKCNGSGRVLHSYWYMED